nr:hypothetical transcript [Hymenolepis microstoma]
MWLTCSSVKLELTGLMPIDARAVSRMTTRIGNVWAMIKVSRPGSYHDIASLNKTRDGPGPNSGPTLYITESMEAKTGSTALKGPAMVSLRHLKARS